MAESTHDFIAKLQKRKMIAEAEESKKIETRELTEEKKEPEVKHSIKQGSPEKGKPMNLPKKAKAKPAKACKEPKNSEDIAKHSISQENKGKGKKSESVDESINESIFVLAGIESILSNDDAKTGAVGALDIIKNYMGGKIDPQYQEFIDMFKSIIQRNTKPPVENDVETL